MLGSIGEYMYRAGVTSCSRNISLEDLTYTCCQRNRIPYWWKNISLAITIIICYIFACRTYTRQEVSREIVNSRAANRVVYWWPDECSVIGDHAIIQRGSSNFKLTTSWTLVKTVGCNQLKPVRCLSSQSCCGIQISCPKVSFVAESPITILAPAPVKLVARNCWLSIVFYSISKRNWCCSFEICIFTKERWIKSSGAAHRQRECKGLVTIITRDCTSFYPAAVASWLRSVCFIDASSIKGDNIIWSWWPHKIFISILWAFTFINIQSFTWWTSFRFIVSWDYKSSCHISEFVVDCRLYESCIVSYWAGSWSVKAHR